MRFCLFEKEESRVCVPLIFALFWVSMADDYVVLVPTYTLTTVPVCVYVCVYISKMMFCAEAIKGFSVLEQGYNWPHVICPGVYLL